MIAQRWIKLWVSVLAISASLFATRIADAKEVEIVAVMWQQDLSAKAEVEQFFGCLTKSSTFGTTWAAEFGLTKVTFKGVYVLSQPCPHDASLGGNLSTILAAAFDNGAIPKPSSGYRTSYLLYLPSGVQGYDWDGVPACQGTYCGVHGTTTYSGIDFDAAIVPIHCPDCGSVQITLIGEHEAAEAIANMGTAQYEVGDACEGPSNETQLACCGTHYPIQQLSSSQSMNDCETIDAVAPSCGCGRTTDACAQPTDCCAGLTCDDVVEHPGKACCSAVGATCTTRADCCGALACTAGACACNPDGQACLTDADCCTGTCDAATMSCGVPPGPDAGPSGGGNNGDDGGSNPHAGCGCDAPGNSGGFAALAFGVALVLRRPRRRARA